MLSPLSALQELHFRNGDRITGELLNRADGKIFFRSTILGDLIIPEVDAAVVELPDTPVEALVGLPPAKEPSKPAPKPAAPVAQAPKADQAKPAAAPPKVASAQPAPKPPAPKPAPKAPPKPAWKGKVEFGFQQNTGRRNLLNTNLRVTADKTSGKNNYQLTTRFLYGKNNGIVNSNRTEANGRWRRTLSERLFAQTVSTYYRDLVKSIDHNYEQNIGIGYALLTKPRHKLNVGIGGTAQYRQDQLLDKDIATLGEFFEDYTFRMNGRFTLLQDVAVQYTPQTRGGYAVINGVTVRAPEDTNYKFRFNSTLQGKVTDKISLNLRFEYEFDNAIVAVNAKTDQRVTSSIGYAF